MVRWFGWNHRLMYLLVPLGMSCW